MDAVEKIQDLLHILSLMLIKTGNLAITIPSSEIQTFEKEYEGYEFIVEKLKGGDLTIVLRSPGGLTLKELPAAGTTH